MTALVSGMTLATACHDCHRGRGPGETLRGWVLAPVVEERPEGCVRCVRWYCPACGAKLPPGATRTGRHHS